MNETLAAEPLKVARKVHFGISVWIEEPDSRHCFQDKAMEALAQFHDKYQAWNDSAASTLPGAYQAHKDLAQLELGKAEGAFTADNGLRVSWRAWEYPY